MQGTDVSLDHSTCTITAKPVDLFNAALDKKVGCHGAHSGSGLSVLHNVCMPRVPSLYSKPHLMVPYLLHAPRS